MMELVNQIVDVATVSRKGRGIVVPIRMRWNGKLYQVREIGLTHQVREGRTLFHIFEGSDGKLSFRLKYNTENLQWMLEAISDGLPS